MPLSDDIIGPFRSWSVVCFFLRTLDNPHMILLED